MAQFRQFILAVLFLLSAQSLRTEGSGGCYNELPPPLPSHVTTASPKLHVSDLPDYFDWRDKAHLSPPTNQFLPSPCGSCWAHAATGALTDRMIIAMETNIPVIPLSPQVLLDCKDTKNLGSCHGGSALGAYAFIMANGITDVTCSPYMGVDDNYWGELSNQEIMCRSCDRFGSCSFVNGTMYHIEEYGVVHGVAEMMNEIYNRGPIACSVYAHGKSFEEYTGGIIQDSTQYNETTHVVTITGWGGGGGSGGMEYWIGRNSFGSVWGEGGWFKLQRGVNALDIEAHTCAWAVPKNGKYM